MLMDRKNDLKLTLKNGFMRVCFMHVQIYTFEGLTDDVTWHDAGHSNVIKMQVYR